LANPRFQRALAARLLALCAVVGVLLITPAAQAAAPWCDALAQTIAAPPPILKQDRAEIAAWHCTDGNQPSGFERGTPAPPDHSPLAAQSASDKAVGTLLCWPPPAPSTRISATRGATALRPGFASTVYRPPRA
jgi:hypothetical protein